jgi:hypothetical protein
MTKLVDALRTKDVLTENGMSTNSTTLNACVDFFFAVGAMRGQDKQRLIALFTKAFAEDKIVATRILFWARDVRGGAGERQIARDVFTYMAAHKTSVLKKNLALISEYGRWDDLLVLVGTKLEAEALELIATALKNGNGLCAKWMPRGNGGSREKKQWAKALRGFLGMDQKSYRKMLAELSTTVEQLMCAKKWVGINYEHVPSKAMAGYMKAFTKNDGTRFGTYIDSVEKGEAKVNTGAVYPYDITKSMKRGDARAADAQWNALPNYMEGNMERVLPIVDVSGSMSTPAGGYESKSDTTCMDVAISLGLYISERNEGIFKDAFVTFSSNPSLQHVSGTLSERYNQMQRADWGMSTDIEATFRMLLKTAKSNELANEDMPSMVLILSDMEFNQATSDRWGGGSEWNPTAQQLIEKMYTKAGYKMPKVVYWNIQSRNSNNPVQFNETDTALVSGFSPALLKNLLAGKDMTPFSMMMDIIGSERYAPVTV